MGSLSTSPLQAVIFDLDGVIIDSEPLHVKADREVFSEYGIELEPADWPALKGLPPRAVFELLCDKYGFQDSFHQFHTKKDAYLAEIFDVELTLFPGFLPLIERLRSSFLFALTTSTHRSVAEFVLSKFKLMDIFQVVTTSDDVIRGKPDPEPYLRTIQDLQLIPEQCVVIEDSVHGIRSAKAAGASCIAVMTSFERDLLAEADIVVEGLESITHDLLNSLILNDGPPSQG